MGNEMARIIRFWALAASVGAALAAAGPARAETLALGGTGAGLATMRALGDAFARERAAAGNVVVVEVLPSVGSSGGVKAVLHGALEVGIIARDLTAAERSSDIVKLPFAATAMAFLTSNRRVKDLTRGDIGAIVLGAAAKWADGTPIRIILRPADDTDSTLFKSYFPEVAAEYDALRRRRELPVTATDQENAKLAEQMPGSFTLGAYAQMIGEKRNLTILSIDGVEPTPANVASKRYPYTKTFYLVVKSKPSPLARAFLDFIASPAGQGILEKTGWTPAAPPS